MMMSNSMYYPPPQAHCPIYLVNVASMSAGDVLASGKMHGKATAFSVSSYTFMQCLSLEAPGTCGLVCASLCSSYTSCGRHSPC